MQLLTRPLRESLLVEVDCVSEARLHLWYLVTDDLHQHFGELHFQSLGLTKGVEAEVQQVPHQLDNTDRHVDVACYGFKRCSYRIRLFIWKHVRKKWEFKKTILHVYMSVFTFWRGTDPFTILPSSPLGGTTDFYSGQPSFKEASSFQH